MNAPAILALSPLSHRDLSIILVSWNVRDLLGRCLESIQASLAGSLYTHETIVVDNASTDGTPAMVRASFPWAKLIVNPVNLGFTRAVNQGMREAQGRYLLLLNPDTEMLGDALPAMLRHMDAHPDAGALGPQLLFPDGSVQSSRRRFPTFGTAFIESTPLQGWFPRHPLLRRYYMLDRSDEEEQEVDWLVGACLLLRREAVEQVGLLDERFFMYSEELDYAKRLRDAGWRVIYYPEARVVHHEARSSEQAGASRLVLFHTSKVEWYAKWFGRWRGELLRWYLLATFSLQWGIEAAKWLAGHKRPLRAERMRAYSFVLRSGLRPAAAAPGPAAGVPDFH